MWRPFPGRPCAQSASVERCCLDEHCLAGFSRGFGGLSRVSCGSCVGSSWGSYGILLGLSTGLSQDPFRGSLEVSRGSRGFPSGSPWVSHGVPVRPFGTRVGSVGLLLSPCPPASSLLVPLPPLVGPVGLRRVPPLSFSSPLCALSGSVGFRTAPSGSVGLIRALVGLCRALVGLSSDAAGLC